MSWFPFEIVIFVRVKLHRQNSRAVVEHLQLSGHGHRLAFIWEMRMLRNNNKYDKGIWVVYHCRYNIEMNWFDDDKEIDLLNTKISKGWQYCLTQDPNIVGHFLSRGEGLHNAMFYLFSSLNLLVRPGLDWTELQCSWPDITSLSSPVSLNPTTVWAAAAASPLHCSCL